MHLQQIAQYFKANQSQGLGFPAFGIMTTGIFFNFKPRHTIRRNVFVATMQNPTTR